MVNDAAAESNRVLRLFRERFSFQISVDTAYVQQGLAVAEAALAAGVTIVELGTPLLKYEGVRNVVPIFRQRFPKALLLADMKNVDGVGIHLQYDARRADPALFQGGTLHDVACAVFESVGDRASVQVVGGLSAEQALALARKGLRAFVISDNLGLPDAKSRYSLPGDEIERHIRDFIDQVSAAG